MRNIKITIQFDGTNYHGWQTQARDITVQKTIKDALEIILNHEVKLHGSGRTDAGVHAVAQVANFTTDSGIKNTALVRGLNRLLPDDILIKDVENVPLDFHSRYSAESRTYRYFIWNTPQRSPFLLKYSWHVRKPLNVELMQKAAELLTGTHDFSSFRGSDPQEVNTERHVMAARFEWQTERLLVFQIQANAFLKRMVRNIIGTLADVGKGKTGYMEIKEIIAKRNRIFAGPAAPAKGLFLMKIKY